MRIILKNIKYYTDQTFDFNEGITLIQGKSGSGKSSIFHAILFVLFGKFKDIVKIGKKKCSVELIITINNINYNIKRTKFPTSLTLCIDNIEEYKDDEAQHLIYTIFGKSFSKTSFLGQNTNGNFLFMTPLQKLHYIEQLIYQDGDNLSDLKQKIT